MFIDDTIDDLARRVDEALACVQKVGPVSSALAETIHREATIVQASLKGLNREGRIRANGFLHALCFAAVVLLEERKSMARTK